MVVDALDSIKTRFIVQSTASKLNIPMIHGAIGGLYGQVTTIFSHDSTLDFIYPNGNREDKELGNPSFTPLLIASIEVVEVIKVLINRGELLISTVYRCAK